jgi:hypothetical protein
VRRVRSQVTEDGDEVKNNTGRPPSLPTKPVVTLTLRIPAAFKIRLMNQAEAIGMTLTEYLTLLVERDGA